MNEKSTILIVDDQLIGRQLLESILFKEEYELIFAEDGEEAIAQTQKYKPDLVLLDVMMPKIDGYEVCRRIRMDAELRETPIIMVTALDDRDSRLMGFDAGSNDYISKPIDRPELLARVKNITDMNRYRKMVQSDGSTKSAGSTDIAAENNPFKDSSDRIEKLYQFLKTKSGEQPALYHKLFYHSGSSVVPEFRCIEKQGEILGMYIHPQIENLPEIALIAELAFYQLAGNFNETTPDHLMEKIVDSLRQWTLGAGVALRIEELPVALVVVNRNQRYLKVASQNVYIWKKSGSGNDVLPLSKGKRTIEQQSLGRAEDLLLASGPALENIAIEFSDASFWQEDNFTDVVKDSQSGFVLVELI